MSPSFRLSTAAHNARLGPVALLVCALEALALGPAAAAPGALDPSFGGDGQVTTRIAPGGGPANSVAIQTDGKIIAAGTAWGRRLRFGLARYNTSGTLNRGFGGDGTVKTDFTRGSDSALAVTIQADGRIVASGVAAGKGGRFALARYNADGTLDDSFGGDGRVITNFTDGTDAAFSVARWRRKIVAAGGAGGLGMHRFAVARYNFDGTLDGTFSGNGRVRTGITRGDDWANGLAVQGNGKIVAAGTGGYARFAIVRYNSEGVPDRAFGDNGMIVTEFTNEDDIAHGVAIDADGKIVAVGAAAEGSGHSTFALARYRHNGVLDMAFGSNGKIVTDFASGDDVANGVAIDADGRVVGAGFANDYRRFALARYLPR